MKDNKNKKEDIFRQAICRKEMEVMNYIEYLREQEDNFLQDILDLKTSDHPIRGQRIA